MLEINYISQFNTVHAITNSLFTKYHQQIYSLSWPLICMCVCVWWWVDECFNVLLKVEGRVWSVLWVPCFCLRLVSGSREIVCTSSAHVICHALKCRQSRYGKGPNEAFWVICFKKSSRFEKSSKIEFYLTQSQRLISLKKLECMGGNKFSDD